MLISMVMIKSLAVPVLLVVVVATQPTWSPAAEPMKSSNAQATVSAGQKAYKDVNVDQFDKLRANTNNIVLDVRTPEEFVAGHIPGATNINFNSPDFEKKIGELDKRKT